MTAGKRKRLGEAGNVLLMLALAGCADPAPVKVNLGQPKVAKVDPAKGPIQGGTPLIIYGVGFQSGAGVKVGDNDCGSVVFQSNNVLTCVTASHAAAETAVAVSNPSGRHDSLDHAFTFYNPAARAISGFATASGAGVATGGGLRLEFSIGTETSAPQTGVGFERIAGLYGVLFDP